MLSLLSSFYAGALAATLVVDPESGPYQSIDEALASAESGDVIEVMPGTYEGSLHIATNDLTIRGAARNDVVLLANNPFLPGDGALVAKGVTLTLENLTLSGRSAARAVRVEGANLTLQNVDLRNGAMLGKGGLLFVDGDSSVIAIKTRFNTGDSGSGAGGLVAVDGTFQATSCTFVQGTTRRQGGALYCGPESECSVQDSDFVDNAAGNGGAVFLEGNPGTWRRNRYCANDALGTDGYTGQGGAIWSSSPVAMQNDVFQENRARDLGGAIYVASGVTTLQNVDLLGNLSLGNGAAVAQAKGATVQVRNALIAYSTGPSAFAVISEDQTMAPAWDAFHENGDMGEFNGDLPSSNQGHGEADPQIRMVSGDCLATRVRPQASSSLIDAGDPDVLDPDGSISDIGSTGGPYACNRAETPGDGVDENCDGLETCWVDTDGDGRGEPSLSTIESENLDCSGEGEADNPSDLCPGFDDRLDCDNDGIPDDCDDPCVVEPPEEAPVTPLGGGGGCAGCQTGSGPASLFAVVVGLLGLLRRRSTGSALEGRPRFG